MLAAAESAGLGGGTEALFQQLDELFECWAGEGSGPFFADLV